jgi:hypothetical protein
MTERKDALIELLAKVEAGAAPSQVEWRNAFDSLIECRPSEHHYPMLRDQARLAFMGSLDAARALHDAVLPKNDKGPAVYINDDDLPTRWYVSIYNNAILIGEGEHGSNPARAWLIAILQALITDAQPAPPPTQEGLDL